MDTPVTGSHEHGIDHVVYGPGSAWSQFDLGTDFDAGTLSVIAELDPQGTQGVVRQVLAMFRESLEPTLQLFEQLRASHSIDGLRFQAHKLYSAAGQVGALRLAQACRQISAYFAAPDRRDVERVDDPVSRAELEALLDDLEHEIVRVQRRLRAMLDEDAG